MKKIFSKQWLADIFSGKRWGMMGIFLSLFHFIILILTKIIIDIGPHWLFEEKTLEDPDTLVVMEKYTVGTALLDIQYYLMCPLAHFRGGPLQNIILLLLNSIIWGFGLTFIYILIKRIFFSKQKVQDIQPTK
jgi:hypothetical protein